MSIWSSLLGHETQKEMFRRTIRRKRLSQAYLFVGPEGIGKQQFARRLAQALLCHHVGSDPLEPCGECAGCKPFLAGSNPDFIYVGCPEGKRELPIELIAGSKERRGQEGLCHDLSLAPLPGSRKVAIVDHADTMNEACANSFLKTLEEPPDRAVLILIASNLDALLPTIRSRCQLVRFSPLQTPEIEKLLVDQDLVQSDEDARFASILSEGSLSTAKQLLEPELRALRSLLHSTLVQPSFSGFNLSKQLLEGIGKISTETPVQRIYAQWLIRFSVDLFREALLGIRDSEEELECSIPEAAILTSRLADVPDSIELLSSVIDRAIDASINIDQNVAVPITLESMLDEIARKLRTPAGARS